MYAQLPPSFWAAIDWSMSNAKIATVTGLRSPVTVACKRKEYAPEEYRIVKKGRPTSTRESFLAKMEELHIQPGDMTRSELAKALGVCYRRILSFKLGEMCKRKYVQSRYNFDSVNWEEQDTLIAKKLGCSRELVRKKRIELEKPKSVTHHKRVNGAFVRARSMNLDVSNMTAKEISDVLDASIPQVYRLYQKKFKKNKHRHSKYAWEKITDEDLKTKTDKEILNIVGCPRISVIHRRLYKGIVRNEKFRKRYNWSLITKRNFRTMLNEQIAEKLGCSVVNVIVYRKAHKLRRSDFSK